jgi:deazaflavin-dependent oxidoreductase (nitroreductase family)
MMAVDTVNGIPRVDLKERPLWKRTISWWLGGKAFTTRTGSAIWRTVVAPVEAPLMKVTRGRVRISFSAPVVVLTSIGARSGERRDIPLTYFTDGDDVILIASNYGQVRHPAWYHNLCANPGCELRIGDRGGRFTAHEVVGDARDRLYSLATDRLNAAFALHEKRSGTRTIPVMRLTPRA